jgi:hypothetical protein
MYVVQQDRKVRSGAFEGLIIDITPCICETHGIVWWWKVTRGGCQGRMEDAPKEGDNSHYMVS